MGFPSGSVSFRRFAVLGSSVGSPTQETLDALSENALRLNEFGVPSEIEYGWSGGRHVLDGNFSFEHNVFADCVSCAMRLDTNKVPGDLKRAYQMSEEDSAAAANPSGFISKAQKHNARDAVRKKVEGDMRSGKFRRSRLIPVLWDCPATTLYCSASGASFERLAELFERTFKAQLMPLTAGSLALQILEKEGRRRDYEDLKPTRFAQGPGGESEYPDYPWVSKGAEPKDFLGNEFLLWLWHSYDRPGGDTACFIDRMLTLECAYGQTGKDAIKGDGPGKMIEAMDGLRSGKVPRKAGMLLCADRQQYSLTLNPELMAIAGGKLPDVEDADSPRVLFEERIGLLRDMSRAIDELFGAFVKIRASSGWEPVTNAIRIWIAHAGKAKAA